MHSICVFFLCPLVCPFITLSNLDRITSKFQRWSLTNELPVAVVKRHQYIFKLEYLPYLLSDLDQICFGKSRMTMSLFCENYFLKSLPVSQK